MGTRSPRGMLGLGAARRAHPGSPGFLAPGLVGSAPLGPTYGICTGPRRAPGARGKGRGARRWALLPSLHPPCTLRPQPARCRSLLPSLPDLNSLVLIPWHPLPGRGHRGGGRGLLGDGCVLCAGEGHPPASQRTCCHSDRRPRFVCRNLRCGGRVAGGRRPVPDAPAASAGMREGGPGYAEVKSGSWRVEHRPEGLVTVLLEFLPRRAPSASPSCWPAAQGPRRGGAPRPGHHHRPRACRHESLAERQPASWAWDRATVPAARASLGNNVAFVA